MKILSQKREGNKVFLEIEEDYPRFLAAFDRSLVEAGKEVKLPGFRPGKAPKAMIEKTLDRGYVEQRAAQNLIGELYPDIIVAAKIEPVDYPSVEITQLADRKPFLFKLTVEVYPTVKLGKYHGLKVEKKPVAVSETEVDQILGRLQERLAVTDASGEKKLLPLDDDFARRVSRHGTLAELKAEVRVSTEKERVAESEADVRNQLVGALTAGAQGEIPAAMVNREVEIMLDELKSSLAQGGLTLADYLRGAKKEEEALRGEMRGSAEIRVKGKVALQAVAAAEKIAVTEAEIAAEANELLRQTGQEQIKGPEQINPDLKKYLEEYLLRKKALDLLLAEAKVKEVKPLDVARGKEEEKK
jgi:FKBP-type peptidyl-prolyl cis-trans isomerase (trigger factor)